MSTFINIAVALAACAWLFKLQRRRASFSVQVFTGMGLGITLGAVMHSVYGVESPVIKDTNAYLDIVGSGYVKLLQMIVIPLIMVSIVAAIVKLKDTVALGKISALTTGTLMLTTLIAAGVGIGMAKLFGLTAVGLTASVAEVAQGAVLQNSQASATAITLPSVILSFIPANPFLDMTGARKTSTIAVVTIGSIGVAGVGGGATFAALIVLSAMNLPVALAGLLISIEPLIDMGRTALNVSGSATAGTVASRLMGQTDVAVFNSDARLDGQMTDDPLPQGAR